VTVAAASPVVTGRWPGARATTCATGSTAAPPTWATWCCCAVGIIMRCTRAAGGLTATPTARSPPSHPTDDEPPPREAVQGHQDIPERAWWSCWSSRLELEQFGRCRAAGPAWSAVPAPGQLHGRSLNATTARRREHPNGRPAEMPPSATGARRWSMPPSRR
jgi:hypothetical protein